VNQIANNEFANTPSDQLEFTYDELMSPGFKLVNAADMYSYDAQYEVYKSKLDDEDFMKAAIAKGSDLSIVGIVRANPDATLSLLQPGFCYSAQMQGHLIEQAATTKIVKDQLARPEIDVITGVSFEEEKEKSQQQKLDFGSMFSVDGDAISAAFTIDPNALAIDTSGFSNLNFDAVYSITPPPLDIGKLVDSINFDIDPNDVAALMNTLSEGFMQYCIDKKVNTLDPDAMQQAYADYLATEEAQAILAQGVGTIAGNSTVSDQLQAALQAYMMQTMQLYIQAMTQSMSAQISSAMTAAMNQISANFANAMGVDEAAIMSAFNFDFDEKEMQELIMSFMSAEENSYESNIRKLGYADLESPASIHIYPKDFASKDSIIKILDDYNTRMEEEGDTEKVLTYTDLVGTLMSSVTDIVNMVSYVLIAFVAISLVVSSIMIGIITYISVLERRKEIGILRAIGASKKDIGHVFNAETFIVGFVAGVLGIAITALLCIPTNIIIYDGFHVPNVASLPWQAGIVLVAISMALSFVAGLIPASSASRKDPVEALRSE
jgi:cell division protein FtsX